MFLKDLWVLVLESLAQLLAIPAAVLKRMADAIREFGEEGIVFLGAITVILSIVSVIGGSIWLFSRPASQDNSALIAKINQLEIENGRLKGLPIPTINPILLDSQQKLIETKGLRLASQARLERAIAGTATIEDFQYDVNETKSRIKEIENELETAKTKPKEAEREISEIQEDLKVSREELKEYEQSLRNAQKTKGDK